MGRRGKVCTDSLRCIPVLPCCNLLVLAPQCERTTFPFAFPLFCRQPTRPCLPTAVSPNSPLPLPACLSAPARARALPRNPRLAASPSPTLAASASTPARGGSRSLSSTACSAGRPARWVGLAVCSSRKASQMGGLSELLFRSVLLNCVVDWLCLALTSWCVAWVAWVASCCWCLPARLHAFKGLPTRPLAGGGV